jgi:hypothetical protein
MKIMQKAGFNKNYLAYLLLLCGLVLLAYLLLESRQRSRQIDKAIKQIPSTIK